MCHELSCFVVKPPAECHVLSCDVMTAMPPPTPCRPVPAYRSSIASRSHPFPHRRWPGARAAGPLTARIARPSARVSAGAVRAPDCACARARRAQGALHPFPGKGPKIRPAKRAAGFLSLCTDWNIIRTMRDFNPCGEILRRRRTAAGGRGAPSPAIAARFPSPASRTGAGRPGSVVEPSPGLSAGGDRWRGLSCGSGPQSSFPSPVSRRWP